MTTIQEFLRFTHMKKHRSKLFALLVIASLFYSVLYAMVHTVLYMGNLIYYYGALYVFVVWAAFIFMVILFQFVQCKRDEHPTLRMRSYILPLWGVQTLFYIVMMGSGMLAFTLAGYTSIGFYIIAPICIVLLILYIPVQVFSLFAIYDGKRNPFGIIKMAFQQLIKHYQTCFYALLGLVFIAVVYHFIMSFFFLVLEPFNVILGVQNIVVASNPFVKAIEYTVYLFQNSKLLAAAITSFVYGICMCFALVHYYMVMLCAYDGDIKV